MMHKPNWVAALSPVAGFVARKLYGPAQDLNDRVGDAMLGLATGAGRFQPLPGRDGLGNFASYTLARAAGSARGGAKQAKGCSPCGPTSTRRSRRRTAPSTA